MSERHLSVVPLFCYLFTIGRVGCDQAFFGFGGDDLDVDVVLAGEEKALADGEVGEALLFFLGQLKDVGEDIDGG